MNPPAGGAGVGYTGQVLTYFLPTTRQALEEYELLRLTMGYFEREANNQTTGLCKALYTERGAGKK